MTGGVAYHVKLDIDTTGRKGLWGGSGLKAQRSRIEQWALALRTILYNSVHPDGLKIL
jgi:hypothetical protein